MPRLNSIFFLLTCLQLWTGCKQELHEPIGPIEKMPSILDTVNMLLKMNICGMI